MWLIIGLVVGAGLLWLVPWLRSRNIVVAWYEWLIGVVGLLLLLFGIQNYAGSLTELESGAANMYLLLIGLPALILLAVACGLAWRRHRTAS